MQQPIKTKRLVLRLILVSDLEEIFYLRSDAVVNYYIKRETPETKHTALVHINKIRNDVHNGNCYYWGITKNGSQKIIGTLSLWNFSKDKQTAEIGYVLNPDFHGKGIMSEALEAVLLFGFKNLKLKHIEAYTHKDNLASLRLLDKLGFKNCQSKIDPENTNNKIFIITS